jgi:RNA polymerase sigma-70 factor (ECF subfamily)
MVIETTATNRNMSRTNAEIEKLIRRARQGDGDALGELLEKHRAYLRVIAKRYIFGKLATRIDASDVIQQTCLSVCGNFDKFQGNEVAEFVAWLRRVHERNIQNVVRDHMIAQKRALGREQSLETDERSPVEFPQANQPTASQRAMRGERAVRLAQVLESLSEDQREVVRLRHLEGWSLARIAEQMDRSEEAIIGLLKRGMQNLRKHLRHDE